MRILISYSRSDKKILQGLVPLIRDLYKDDSLWFDENIPGGDDWWNKIVSEIRNCTIFIFLVSDNALESQYCQKELRKAIEYEKHILPVIIKSLKTAYPGNAPYDLAKSLVPQQLKFAG